MDSSLVIDVTIVVPLYNVAEYLIDCLYSIAAQTYLGTLECILVDDCGTDESCRIADNFIRQYCGNIRFQLIHHQINRGASAARNTGLNAAHGRYITYVDGDDWIKPSYIQDMMECHLQYPQADLIHIGIETTDGSIPWFNFENTDIPRFTNNVHDIKTRLLGRGILPTSPCGKLIKTEFLRQNHITFYEGIVMEDVLWCNILAKYVRAVACVLKNGYVYRIHDGSVVTSGLGVDPNRKLIVYGLMIEHIDTPYVYEQVQYLVELLDNVYFATDDRSIRRKVAKLDRMLSVHASGWNRARLILKSFLGNHDTSDQSIAYYIYYLLSTEQTFLGVLKAIVYRLLRRK